MPRNRLAVWVTVLSTLIVAGVVIAYIGLTGMQPDPPRVGPMMLNAGCVGKIIDTQLYAVETGRCTYQGAEVTIAAFHDDGMRDKWVTAARQFGGTFVTGQLWAAMVSKPDQAPRLARALGGAVLA